MCLAQNVSKTKKTDEKNKARTKQKTRLTNLTSLCQWMSEEFQGAKVKWRTMVGKCVDPILHM